MRHSRTCKARTAAASCVMTMELTPQWGHMHAAWQGGRKQ